MTERMMKSWCSATALVALVLVPPDGSGWPFATAPGLASPERQTSELFTPDAPGMNQQAPTRYRVELDTSQGRIIIEVHRDWAPRGADRFYNLVRAGFYDAAHIFRVIEGAWAQFGINGDPEIAAIWRSQRIPDDPVVESNRRGYLSYAMSGPDDRTTQVFINLRDNAERLDPQGFSPFGVVIDGMDVADRLYAGYGEGAGGGIRGGKQDPLFRGGNAYMTRAFPKLDVVRTARVVEIEPDGRTVGPARAHTADPVSPPPYRRFRS